MELKDEFEVTLPIAEAWAVLTDAEKILPLVPGAELREVEGDEPRGVMKVKVGSVAVSYRGDARLESLDAGAFTAVLKAEGREVRGQGNATAVVTATLSSSARGTRVQVTTDLSVSGKLAQFDRDEMAETSRKLVAEFARNLESAVVRPPETVTAEPGTEAEIDADVYTYTAEIAAEIAADVVEVAEEAVSEVADSYDAIANNVTYLPTAEPEPEPEGESLLKRLTPYLTVAGLLLIARIVVYSLRRRRR